MSSKSIDKTSHDKLKLQAKIKRLELEQLCLEMKLKLLEEELKQQFSEQESILKKKKPHFF